MKNNILLLFSFILIITVQLNAQNYTIDGGNQTTCSGTIRDAGGTGDYSSSEDYTMTITPGTAGDMIELVFSVFETESISYDWLEIYDGTTIVAPLLDKWGGTTGPGTVTATNITGALTLVWHSDGSNVDPGFAAAISCVPPPPTYLMTNGLIINTCSGFFMDDGGLSSDYTDNNNTITETFCSDNGESIRIEFNAFETREVADNLVIYDGPNTLSPPIGTSYSLTNSPGIVVSSGTCLTFAWSTDNNGTRPGWESTISCIPPPPANDECANAIALTVNPDYSCGAVTAGTVLNSTASSEANGCFGTSDDDVWYTFVATNTTHRVSLINVAGSVTDMYHAVYSGTCGSLTQVLCSDADVSNHTGLTIGTTYHVRVYTYTATAGQNSTFEVCIGSPPPPPPNDECAGAINITVNPDQSCAAFVSSYTISATNSGIAACAGSGADDDVWFTFTATNTSHEFSLLNIAGTSTDMMHEIFTGNCASLTSIACSDPNTSTWGGFTVGSTYYVRVYTYFTSGTASFDICIGTPPPPPSNDEPCGAIPLAVNTGNCSYQSAVLGVSTTATAGVPVPGCGSLGPDVWYTAVVPASGRLIIDMDDNGGPTNMDMAWYSAPNCSGPFTLIECDAFQSTNGSMPMICRSGAICTVPGDCDQNATLTPGQTIYVRIWEYGGGTTGPFDICAYEPGAPGAPSNCASPTNIASLPFSESNTTCCRNNDYDNTVGCGSSYQDGEDFIYTYTPTVDEIVDISITGSLSYTAAFVTDRCPSDPSAICIGQNTNSAGNPMLCGVSLIALTTYYIMIDTDPGPTCTPFNIRVSSSSAPTCGLNYTISNITYAPDLNNGTNISLPVDDRFSSSYIPIGFPFCYDGFQFTQLLVSSNGYVIFDPISCASNFPTTNAAPGGSSGWDIDLDFPNTTQAPRNCVMFPFQDIYPSYGGTIKYQTLGTAPNRRFVLTFYEIPYFSCTSILYTGQLKLFETSNDIEMHIADKVTCATWNEGGAVMGLHNFNGTIAVIPGGANYSTSWTVHNKAWHFDCHCLGCIVLPIELMSFEGEQITSFENKLNWTTVSELNNNYFEVERKDASSDEFIKIGEVDGAGFSNVVKDYAFIDDQVTSEINYYRLKQVDYDGEYSYTKTIVIGNTVEDINSMYPNPATDILNLNINADAAYVTVYIVNTLGEVVYEEQFDATNSIKTAVDVSQFAAGNYHVLVRDDKSNVVMQEKLIIK